MNGLPDLRLLPDAPIPDGRTVLTGLDATGIEAVMGHGQHLGPFIRDTNAIENLNRQLRKAICATSRSLLGALGGAIGFVVVLSCFVSAQTTGIVGGIVFLTLLLTVRV